MKRIYHFNFSPHFLRYNVHLENFNTTRNMHKFYASEQNIYMITLVAHDVNNELLLLCELFWLGLICRTKIRKRNYYSSIFFNISIHFRRF